MSTIVVDPITRIEGHLRIETEVDAGGTITKAYSSGTMFRGLETILQGRDPRDAWAFTQRICGVCTVVHSMTSIRAVENALKYPIPTNARLIRNIMSGSQMVQDQVVHFYQLTSPDWMNVPSALAADPARTANLQRCMSDWPNNTESYFAGVKDALAKFVNSGQLGIFGNAYWDHPGYKLPPEMNLLLFAHYLEALNWQREVIKIHTIFGGRNPHPNFVIGGVPCAISATPSSSGGMQQATGKTAVDAAGLTLVGDMITKMRAFVDKVHVPDMLAMARFYPEWFQRGDGLGNFLTFGDYPEVDNTDGTDDPEKFFIPRRAILWPRDSAGLRRPLSSFRLADAVQPVDLNDPAEIQEFVAHSWLSYGAGKDAGLHPYAGETTPAYTGPKTAYAPHDPAGPVLSTNPEYSWLKTPRWKGNAMEVGPLSRVLVLYATGNAAAQDLVNRSLTDLKLPLSAMFSTMGRLLGEVIDTKILGDRTQTYYDQLMTNIGRGDLETHNPALFDPATWPAEASGVGYSEAPRGALGHWVTIKNGRIDNYQCVVPTTWNAAPRDVAGNPSPYEAALVGHTLAVPNQPLEILRTIHSFNPCMACAVHLMDPEGQETLRVTVQG
ncbi:MAG TPA: nickel-dependent hydrogenase large subunit [Burkholderiales bacterium]